VKVSISIKGLLAAELPMVVAGTFSMLTMLKTGLLFPILIAAKI